MTTYDDMTEGSITFDERFILLSCNEENDMVFKASYIVVPNIKCKGKITALFDLILLGDVEAKEIEVKGKFVCLGNCMVSDSVVVQNEIWVNDLRSADIESHDRIFAQEIDVGTIVADGSIVVGKTLAVEKLARSDRNILCGETAFGSGKVSANIIITGEPLDLDDGGESAIEVKYYKPNDGTFTAISEVGRDLVERGLTEFATQNAYSRYIDLIKLTSVDESVLFKLEKWRKTIAEIDSFINAGIKNCRNLDLLLWLTEIVNSDYFKNWTRITEWYGLLSKHFKRLTNGENIFATPVPVTRLAQGNIISYMRYGKGIVEKISEDGKRAIVRFDNGIGAKEFILDVAMPHFLLLGNIGSGIGISSSDIGESIKCRITCFSEWLGALDVLRRYKSSFDERVYEIAFDLVVSNLGLKSKFVSDRLSEKGWDVHAEQ